MISNYDGDIFNKFDLALNAAIFHGANCFNTMGSGIALSIKQNFPEAYSADCLTIKGDRKKLGIFSTVCINTDDNKHIYNLYQQYNYGRDSRKLNYEAFYRALESAAKDCEAKKIKTILIPYKIGCNLAGGDWKIVYSMICAVFEFNNNFNAVICRLENT